MRDAHATYLGLVIAGLPVSRSQTWVRVGGAIVASACQLREERLQRVWQGCGFWLSAFVGERVWGGGRGFTRLHSCVSTLQQLPPSLWLMVGTLLATGGLLLVATDCQSQSPVPGSLQSLAVFKAAKECGLPLPLVTMAAASFKLIVTRLCLGLCSLWRCSRRPRSVACTPSRPSCWG